jgi:aspartate carbamoyltransferase regulatory subunit
LIYGLAKYVVDKFKKDPPPEINKIISVQNENTMPQEPKTLETTDKVDWSQAEELQMRLMFWICWRLFKKCEEKSKSC